MALAYAHDVRFHIVSDFSVLSAAIDVPPAPRGMMFALVTSFSDQLKIPFAAFDVNFENDAVIFMSDQSNTTVNHVRIRYPIIPPTKLPIPLNRSPLMVISVQLDRSFMVDDCPFALN